MSEKSEDAGKPDGDRPEELDQAGGDSGPDAGDDAGAETSPEARPARPGGRAPAWLALVLALAAACVAGWQAWQLGGARDESGSRVTELGQRLDRLDRAVEELRAVDDQRERAIGQVRDRADRALDIANSLETDIERLRAATDELSREIAALQGTQSEQAQRLDSIAQRLERSPDDSPDRELALAQAEYLIRTAYRMLELERDPGRAAQALALAAGRLEGISAPGLTRVREALARELEAVRAVEPVDRAGLAARLAALAERSASLPLRDQWGSVGVAPEAGEGEAADAGERGWWQATRDFMGEYFTVRRTDEAGTALPDPATLRLMREVLRLELEQARMALLRQEPELYRQSLERAASLMEQYFAAQDPAVRSALATVAELRERDIAPPVPEHGAALDALLALRGRNGESG